MPPSADRIEAGNERNRFVRSTFTMKPSREGRGLRFAALAIAVGVANVAAAEVPAAKKRPNVVLIMADDMGYECVGANGGTSYATPALDRLAAEGMRFEHCYSQPICTPSRVKLMTGIYNQRNYIRFGLLDPAATTFAHLFRDAGYATAVAGKWQLGGGRGAPRHFGFDEWLLWQLTVRESRYPNPVLETDGRVVTYENGEYGPDLVTDFLCDFVRRHRDRPFLVYYPMILPHWPFEPTPDSTGWNPKAKGVLKGKGDPRLFRDMVQHTDKVVGRIVRELDELDIRDRTLVLFTGDNGTAAGIRSQLDGRTVVGAKGKTTDAGTRAPFIASWPGVIRPGSVSSDLVDLSDFLPTIAEAAGIEVPAALGIDGRSFLPQLRGEAGHPRPWLHCWYARNGGPTGREFVRTQRYKLYRGGELYDIAADPLEARDLAGTDLSADAKKIVDELRSALATFDGTRASFPEWMPLQRKAHRQALERIRTLGGQAFERDGRVVEVRLNGHVLSEDLLATIGRLHQLTDLSLERSTLDDDGARHLARLPKIEWLNLYRTRLGDEGLRHLSRIPTLKLLPIGGTRVTDEGLRALADLRGLEYLGLRDNAISDRGLRVVERLTNLRGLHLGGTRVTAKGLPHLRTLAKLEKLWLGGTTITDAAVDELARLKTLRELYLPAGRFAPDAAKRLRASLPACRIVFE